MKVYATVFTAIITIFAAGVAGAGSPTPPGSNSSTTAVTTPARQQQELRTAQDVVNNRTEVAVEEATDQPKNAGNNGEDEAGSKSQGKP
ncbi:MAG: hypothetical protein BMS9Abin26_0885 [Gammaproteobacteria bacterium]|nr:MAG: hypothetical protein BMS9Abin26_0885 [Gammaproteobacteria bacterium]